MNKELNQRDLEEILNSLDSMKRAEAPPYLLSRTINTWKNQKPQENMLFEPRLRILGLVLGTLFLFNSLFFLYEYKKIGLAGNQENTGIQSFSAEFGLSPNSPVK